MNKKIIALIGAIIVILCVVILFVVGNNGKYEVKFNTNGGTIIEVQNIKKGETASKPADPTKDGYVFDNWYLNDKVYDFSSEVTENITLEAKWTKVDIDENDEYTVTFNTNGGSKISSVKVTEGNKVTKPTDPTKDGYKFVEWLLDGKSYDFTKKVTENITLVASWVKNDSVDTVKVTGITISKTSLSLNVGDTSTLTVTIKPTNATNKTATWKTSNANVATVVNGKVTAKAAGTATITVTVDGKSATSKITVAKAAAKVEETKTEEIKKTDEVKNTEVKVTSVTISKTSLDLKVGGTASLTATINPSNATNKTTTWTSSNTNVATVVNGKVTAKATGEATITVTVDGKTATAKVTVTKEITYSIYSEKDTSSIMDEYNYYIKSSEGNYVSGRIEYTTSTGKKEQMDITSAGVLLPKNLISDVKIISVN